MLTAKSSMLCIVLLCSSLITVDAKTLFNETYELESWASSVEIHNSLLTVITGDRLNISHTSLDGKGKLVSCQLWLGEDLSGVKVVPITAQKAILVYTSNYEKGQYIKYKIVNFGDCRISEALKISFEKYGAGNAFEYNRDLILINDDGTFGILSTDDKLCKDKICRSTFDDQGNKVEGPIFSFTPQPHSYRKVDVIPSSSNFVVRETDNVYKTSLIKTDGQVLLKNTTDRYNFDVSTSHGLIRLCTATRTTEIACELFDYNGKATSNVSVIAPQKVDTVAVQNLATGEFMLQIGGLYEKAGAVMKVKSDGSVVGVAELSHLPCYSSEGYRISSLYVSNDQYCTTRVCVHSAKLEVLKECYDDIDFH